MSKKFVSYSQVTFKSKYNCFSFNALLITITIAERYILVTLICINYIKLLILYENFHVFTVIFDWLRHVCLKYIT